MIDTAKIIVCGGNGGSGIITFAKAKFKPKGPPMGGSGGSGGAVYLIADTNVATLKDFVSTKVFRAINGDPGGPNDRTGKCAPDLFIKVPVGTTVKTPSGKIITDLDEDKERILVARGGIGGRGNAHMPKAIVPKFGEQNEKLLKYTGKRFSKERHIYYAEKGDLGESVEILLELKLIADVGFIGLPNAGKSSLLNTITKTTKAPVGSYPFTTLEPNLGIITTGNLQETRIILADIPGLIEGAYEGKGLGDKFLKHIERTKLLVHIIDIENVTSDIKTITKAIAYKTIREELYKWDKSLIEKPEIIVVNKIDTVKLSNQLKETLKNVIFTSAVSEEGVKELKERIIEEILKQRTRETSKKKESPTLTFTLDNLLNDKIVFK